MEEPLAEDPEAFRPSPFWQSLEEVKLCYAKLEKEIAALEAGFHQELEWQAQKLTQVGATDRPAPKKPAMNKKKKKVKAKVDPTTDDVDGHADGVSAGAELDDVEEHQTEDPARALTFHFDDAEDSKPSEESAAKSPEDHAAFDLKKSTTTQSMPSAAMAKVRTQHGTLVDPQVKAFTTELAEQDGDEDALNTRLQLAKAKLESCRRKSNVTVQKLGMFLSIALGKKNHEPEDLAEIRWLVFEFFAALMIVANSVVLGMEIAHLASHMEPSEPLQIISLLFTNWFILEVIIRIRVTGIKEFFTNSECLWNWTDLALAFVSVFELAFTSFGTSSGSRSPLSTLRAIKIIRVVRLFRLFRFFPQLARLAFMVADSVRHLVWALLMFMLIMYVWAVTLTEACTDWIKTKVNLNDADFETQIETGGTPGLKEVYLYFGSLERSIYTLFQVSLGGISWHEVTDAVGNVDWFSFTLLFAYVIFTILALMNVFTGVFVDKAVQNSKKQRKSQIEDAIEKKRTLLDQIVEFFVATDVNGDGTISAEEIQILLHDPVMSAYFDTIGFRPGDAKLVAELLDHDNSGDISLNEFISGCERLRGDAKGIDIHLLLMECYQISEKLDRLHEGASISVEGARGSQPRSRASFFHKQIKRTLSNLPG